MPLLTGINSYTIYSITCENEVFDGLSQRVVLEPLNHLLPLRCEESLASEMYVGKECCGDGRLLPCLGFGMLS